MTTKELIEKYQKLHEAEQMVEAGEVLKDLQRISKTENTEKIDLIGKDIRCIDEEIPVHGKIVAIDIRGRMIMCFDGIEEDVFAYDTMEEAHCVFEKPEEIEEFLYKNGRKYKLLSE